jgi:hypothetical protein
MWEKEGRNSFKGSTRKLIHPWELDETNNLMNMPLMGIYSLLKGYFNIRTEAWSGRETSLC